MTPLIVVTGATGFIGSAVVRELARRPVRLRLALRGSPPIDALAQSGPAERETVHADLGDPDSLRGLCEGADALLHLASYVGSDARLCDTVNRRGTAALASEAITAAVPRVVLSSTCAVYGPGPHRDLTPTQLAPSPVSAASASRLAAEEAMLAAGAVVLRAGLVLGAGDRWVVPAIAELVRRVPPLWNGGRGLLSAVAVEDLARLIADLACAPPTPRLTGTIHHAAHPQPVRNRDLLASLTRLGLLPAGTLDDPAGEDRPWPWCLDRLRLTAGEPNARLGARHLELLAGDHWYRSDAIWQLAGTAPGPGPLARLPEMAAWYRAHLALPVG